MKTKSSLPVAFAVVLLTVVLAAPAFGQSIYEPYSFTTMAGSVGVIGNADGIGNAAQFYEPIGVAVDSAGNVYVADYRNFTIRKIDSVGMVTTLAGSAGNSGSADGTGSAARFNYPTGVAVDSAGNVYVADYFNSTIRKIDPVGMVTTLAGLAGNFGSADGTGGAARFNYPRSVAVDSAGNVYVADYNNFTIRKIDPIGVVTTLAGSAGNVGSADGTGGAARFNYPSGVAVDSAGNVYVADSINFTIRKIDPIGVVTTLAGSAGNFGSADGTGGAARFNYPYGVAVDSAGNVYVADFGNGTIRKIGPIGVVTTLAGSAGNFGSADGTGSAAQFNRPIGVAVDSAGKLYVADTQHAIRAGVNAIDLCPLDPNKTDPGACGCGVPDTDSDGDGIPDCIDPCPNDVLIPAGAIWKYLDDGSDQATAWLASGFPEPGWSTGMALFGVETSPAIYLPSIFSSPMPVGGGRVTYYFRTQFSWSGSTVGAVLTAQCFIDDGAVFYINGFEAARVRMTANPVLFNSLAASSSVEGVLETITLSSANLVSGINVLAVEVHQNSATSSDVVFGLTLEGGCPDPCVVDSDADGTADCFDLCPNDPAKTAPGACGCGVPDTDSDFDGTPDCLDGCPGDAAKTAPGACGCGVPDTDSDVDGTPDCIDPCPNGILIPVGASWKYLNDGTDPGPAWFQTPFIDNPPWPSGPGVLGFETNPSIAPLIQTLFNNYVSSTITYYFQHHFNFPGNPAGVTLMFSARVDDGAVFYLNGVEIQRLRMPPTGLISYGTLASSTPPTTDAVSLDVFFVTTDTVTGSPLLNGDNVLAVEVHQINNVVNSDIVFGLTLEGCPPDPCLADTTAPVVPVVTLANTIAANQTAVPLSISGEVGATISYVISDGTSAVNGSGSMPVSGTFSVTVDLSSLLDGALSASATLTDACGNTSAAGTTTASKNTVPQTPVITWPAPASIIYGTPLGVAQLNATTTVPGTFAYSPPAGTVLAAAAGQTLMVSFTPNDLASYNPATASVLIDVTPKALTVKAQNKNNVYGSALPTLTATYTGFVNGDSVASLDTPAVLSTTATAASGVGTYPIVVSGASDANYAITFVNGTLTVTPHPLTITAKDKNNVYGSALPTLAATYAGFVNGDNVASLDTAAVFSTTATAASGVGNYPIVVSGASDANYTITFVNGTFTVTPKTLTVKAQNKSNVYGSGLPTLTATYAGFVNGDGAAGLDTPAVLSTTATAASGVGIYPIVVSGASDANYTITFVNGTLSVAPHSLTIKALNKNNVYGTALPTLTATYQGFVNGDTVASLDTAAVLSTTATPASAVGTYPIVVSGASDANYTITFLNGTLTVIP